MKDIEVGEYVRTKTGEIHKIKTVETRYIEFEDGFGVPVELKEYIKKHTKNIIDLIEVTDIIKYRINNISTTLETKGYIEGIVDISDKEMLQRIKNDKNYEILEILTHEQFEQNSYKVGGEDESN